MMDAISRHKSIVFMFSGGKDSLACLYLLKPHWDKINVIWVNTGNFFPENEKIVRSFSEQLPRFHEIKTDVNSFKETYGLPSDMVPISHTYTGSAMTGEKEIKIISGYDCCAQNLWLPALSAAKELGATLIIRGQRNQESAKSPIQSGEINQGFEFLFPIEDWTQDEVLAYLKENGFDYPEFFNFVESSLDCINCTAFLGGIKDRREYMQKNHPVEHKKNNENLEKILSVISHELAAMKESLCLV